MDKPTAGKNERVIGIEQANGDVSYVVVEGASNDHVCTPAEGQRPVHHVGEDADGTWIYRPAR